MCSLGLEPGEQRDEQAVGLGDVRLFARRRRQVALELQDRLLLQLPLLPLARSHVIGAHLVRHLRRRRELVGAVRRISNPK